MSSLVSKVPTFQMPLARCARAARALGGAAASARPLGARVACVASIAPGAPFSRGTSFVETPPGSSRARVASRGFAAEAAPSVSEDIEMKGVSLQGRPLYLDMQATTPVDPRVLDAICLLYTSPSPRD